LLKESGVVVQDDDAVAVNVSPVSLTVSVSPDMYGAGGKRAPVLAM
jgi:hypothetical protein